MKTFVILGNQLFAPAHLGKEPCRIFMREDEELCTYFKFHKIKITFFLAAMRSYAKELEAAGHQVTYQKLPHKKSQTYDLALAEFLKANKVTELHMFEVEDKFFEKRLKVLCAKSKVELVEHPSPMFLTSRSQFEQYLKKSRRPFMKTFYEQQRKRLKILVDEEGQPEGGKWSFDTENRKPLPAKVKPPLLDFPKTSPIVEEVQTLCHDLFPTHPGDAKDLWLPVERKAALKHLDKFIEERLEQFGPYEDAIPVHSDFLFHSVLTPFLNTGLLTPSDVVKRVLKHRDRFPIASLEGFIRQVIGWREFIRGIYQNFSDEQDTKNFFNHKRKLKGCWYDGTTGIPPLDNAIKKTVRYAYAHHIERLMVVGSQMLLLEVAPKEAHRWFMEMFVDSSDWVMGPNVYGMALFSDGGIFATKPYICGSNYYRKMGGYKAGDWCDASDGLYWRFVDKHRALFLKNPRLSMMVKTVDRMDPKRKALIYKAAQVLQDRLVE